MTLRGRPLQLRVPERKSLAVYVVPRTHLLVRLLAENEGTTIGRLVDALVAEEADRRGICLGDAA